MENAEVRRGGSSRRAALRGWCAAACAAGLGATAPVSAQPPTIAAPSVDAELPPPPPQAASRRRLEENGQETFSAKSPEETIPSKRVVEGLNGSSTPLPACDVPSCRTPWWGPPATPSPQGTCLQAWRSAQVARAEESRLVFFRDEWYQGGAKLGPAGREHLEEVAAALRLAPQPVTIVPATVVVAEDDDVDAAYERAAALDAQRRRHLAEALARAGAPLAPELVRTARPIAEGLDGNEANRVYRGQLGGQGGQSGGGFGGMNAGGMGAGGGAMGGGGFGVR